MKYFVLFLMLCGRAFAATLPPSTTYQVNLSWNAPTDMTDPVVGYNMYRAQGSGSFSVINSVQITGTTYVDSALLYGVSYNYYVKSVDASKVESDPSNTFTAQIPYVPYTPVVGTLKAI